MVIVQKSVGRVVGITLLLQMAAALIAPFVLMDALIKGYPAYLDTAAANAGRIRVGVAVAFFGLGMTITLGVWFYDVLKPYSNRTALWFFAVCLVSAAVDAVHNSTVLSMLAAAEKFSTSGVVDTALYQAWGAMAASMRRSAHIVQLVAIGTWMATLYISLWRYRLIPRLLSLLGLFGVVSQFIGVTVMMFLGFSPNSYLAMPLAPIHAATAIWLIAVGFRDRTGEIPVEAND